MNRARQQAEGKSCALGAAPMPSAQDPICALENPHPAGSRVSVGAQTPETERGRSLANDHGLVPAK